MEFTLGHRRNRRYVEFPHLCPGENCAIARWAESVTACQGKYEYEIAPGRWVSRERCRQLGMSIHHLVYRERKP